MASTHQFMDRVGFVNETVKKRGAVRVDVDVDVDVGARACEFVKC